MTQDGNPTLISGKAYRIFLTEFEKHMAYLDRFLGGQIQRSSDALQEAAARFHTIKGGCGFFGFNEIYKSASKLETMLQKPSENLDASWAEFERTYGDLKRAAADLPHPTE